MENISEVLIRNGDKANWGTDSAPIDPKRLPEGYPWKEGVTIEWDGNREGLVAVGEYYRVSDVILSDEQIKAGIVKNSGEEEIYVSTVWDYFVNAGHVMNDIVILESFIFVRKDNVSFEGLEFKKAGVYFFRHTDTDYAQRFTNETIRPIVSDFLPLPPQPPLAP